MGLQSAMTVSLTGLQAAETVIDVVGNNVANSGTVGFKESDVLFATQFLQTQSIGSAPTESTGGTNPRQVGLGVKVAAINPDFTQGTIQISSNPLDLAIQGDGFLIVQSSQGEQLYTRNGQLQTNSQNEIVTVTGNRVLGLGVDDDFTIDEARGLVPLTIPLGSQTVAQETQNAFFTGNLNPSFEIGTSGVITSQAMGNADFEVPGNFDSGDIIIVGPPDTTLSDATPGAAGTEFDPDTYRYRLTWYKTSGANTYESAASGIISATVGSAVDDIQLADLPTENPSTWDGKRIYRSIGSGDFELIGTIGANVATYSDTSAATLGTTLSNPDGLNQQDYSYYVTFRAPSGVESRPTALAGPFTIDQAGRRIRLNDIPQPSSPAFTQICIYRNLGTDANTFYHVATLNPGVTTYVDSRSDQSIIDANERQIDLLGPKAENSTLLTDVVLRNGDTYTQPFQAGTLTFTGTKGGRELASKQFRITASSTVQELRRFMEQAYGLDVTNAPLGGSSTVSNGQLVFTSNRGEANELGTGLASFVIDPDGNAPPTPINFSFANTTEAVGQGTTTSFVVFDSLGEPLNVQVITYKESETATSFSYRWIATSEDNELGNGNVSTLLGNGLITFDRNGNITAPENGRELIAIAHPAELPLRFNLDFNALSGLSQTNSAGLPTSNLTLTRQDGFPPGSLTSFTITESGLIRGVFSNGAERALGQIQIARFANAAGLQQVGNNMYSTGVNSGEPVIGDPGEGGLGTITAGAVELSNSDIGQNLIELILASTQYRGGARVITTAQQLLDELLNLRR